MDLSGYLIESVASRNTGKYRLSKDVHSIIYWLQQNGFEEFEYESEPRGNYVRKKLYCFSDEIIPDGKSIQVWYREKYMLMMFGDDNQMAYATLDDRIYKDYKTISPNQAIDVLVDMVRK